MNDVENELFDNEIANENLEPETNDNKEKTKKIDETSPKGLLINYSVERMSDSIIGESHTRQTYLVDDETIEKLNRLVSYVQASNGIDSEKNNGLNKNQINKGRALTKGFKSKFVNFAIKKFIEQWEQQEAPIPDVRHKKSKVGKVYHNYYMFTENGVTYGIEQDNRGKEIRYLSTTNGDSVESIEQWFDNIEDQTKPEGRPKNDK